MVRRVSNEGGEDRRQKSVGSTAVPTIEGENGDETFGGRTSLTH